MAGLPWSALLVAAWLGGAALTLIFLHTTDWRGDEYTYTRSARAIGLWIAGRGGTAGATLDTVIGEGWFMPGIAAIAAVPYALLGEPAQWIVRGWIGLVNLALSLVAVRQFAGLVGWRHARIALVFPALVPLWHVASLSILAEVPAALVLAIALIQAMRIARDTIEGVRPRPAHIAMLSALLAVGIYLRGPIILPALAIFALLVLIALLATKRDWRGIASLAGGAVLVALALAPWSWAVSSRFGEFVPTTTNVPLVLADGFGDPATNCLGPCPPGQDIWPAWHAAQRIAAATGQNPLAVQRQIRDRALEGLSLRDYLAKVRRHFGTFLFDPGGRLRKLLPVSYGLPAGWRSPAYTALVASSLALYVPFMLALLAANLAVFRSNRERRLQAVFLKLATACLAIQPFVHKSSARYWVGLAPLAALAAVLLWRAWREGEASPGRAPADTVLDTLQYAWSAAIVIVAGTLALA